MTCPQLLAAPSSAPINAKPRPIRVAIVDDDARFLDELCRAMSAAPDMHLVGVASTRTAGLALLDGMPADVLLVDLALSDGSGLDVIRTAATRWPACNVMVSTMYTDEQNVMHSIEAGAAGYLLKDRSSARLVDEIRSVASGGSPISPIIARQLIARLRLSCVRDAVPSATPACPLSGREKEVLELITKGFKAQEIATLMELSPFTVKTFVRRIYSKLKVTSRAEAIYEARTLGLLAG
jgi:DNA-binding NarL/FixJ family response regulator